MPLVPGQSREGSAGAGNDVRAALGAVVADHGTRITATLIRSCGGDFQLAEDAFQEAVEAALRHWPAEGLPARPDAWLFTAARRGAIDHLRRDQRFQARREQLRYLLAQEQANQGAGDDMAGDEIEDDRLRLIFTCCHPALALEARVALTLRTIGRLETEEIARAFLVSPDTMAKRLVRARAKIREARIPYRVPAAAELPARLESVLAVIYLVFNEGYLGTASPGLVRADLCDESLRLARLLLELMPDEPEVMALLALVLLNDSRRAARTDASGDLLVLDEQDRSLWDRAKIDEGLGLVDRALRIHNPGPFQVQAAIAAVHAEAARPEDTDWRQVALLYGQLLRYQASPVVALNRAAAVGMAAGPEHGITLIDDLDASGELAGYHLLPAARADLLRRASRFTEAAVAYREAIVLCTNEVERRYLQRRLRECGGQLQTLPTSP